MLRAQGFFNCACGKLHTVSPFNRACDCGRKLLYDRSVPSREEVVRDEAYAILFGRGIDPLDAEWEVWIAACDEARKTIDGSG